ncbi:hypothetical protein [Peribacillus sp. NPDC096540]|uniref:hypothetical protein n=1 Tax=Peribacillus sp. NPDC096540 TaxID=3390612 RepID=UPI003D05E73F
MNKLHLEHIFSITELPNKYESTNLSADFKGQLIVMGVENLTERTFKYDIYHFNNHEIQKYTISPVRKLFNHIQRLNDGWLLAESRADDENVKNATIFDDYGNSIISFHLGDGIENLQVSENGDIWVGYFDEGVYGQTVGGSGLSCFNSKGKQVFDFTDFSWGKKDIPPIDDCYALNVVSNDEIYCYYYSDFPLLSIKNMNEYRIYNKLKIKGSNAFAVWQEQILFGPTYSNDKNFLYSYSLRDKSIITYKPVNRNGEILRQFNVIGRKSNLYLVDEKDVYGLDLKVLIK